MAYEYIILERVGRVGVITLNRPDELNTLHGGQGAEMRQAVFELDADPQIGAMVMTANGRAFCAGANVKQWNNDINARQSRAANPAPAAQPAAPRAPYVSWNEVWSRVKPSVVAFNGLAIGAGLTITLGADYRIASERARLSMRFAAVGIVPEIESTMLLPQICGFSNAMDLMISGEIVDAQHALRVGLVNEVVPHEELRDRAIAKAASYARNHPDVTRTVKQLVWSNFLEGDLSVVRQREGKELAAASRGAPHAEAVRAFLGKREPKFYPDPESV